MNIETLKEKLKTNNIPQSLYSLDEGLKPMAYIYYKNYSQIEIFYLNERGGQDGFRTFYSEEEACDYFWSKMEHYLKNPPSIPPKSIFGK